MDFRILGPVEASKDGVRVALSGSKVHTVLAALLLARGRVVSDERLSSLLWGWEPPTTPGAQIYTYMSRLRKLLGDDVSIERRQPGYVLQLQAPSCSVDFLEFERLDRQGRAALREERYEEAGEVFARALGLWRGPALANVTEYLADAEIPQLEEARMNALENRIEADLALGRHAQLTAELTGLVAGHPLRERLRAQLMTALYRCGRQADALQAYYEGRDVLADQLGVDPGEELATTYQAVLVGSLGAPAPRAAEAVGGGDDAPLVSMLPPDLEDFTGRRAELDALTAQLTGADAEGTGSAGGPRRVLVTGMAGIGKTALAVRAAHLSAEHFPDGQLFAELTDADGRPRDPRDVLVSLLRDLDVNEDEDRDADLGGLVRRFRTRTARKRLLLVLDGVADSDTLAPLMPASAHAVVLLTSRARLTPVTCARTTALAPLGRDEAHALLARTAGRERLAAEPEAADALLRYCAGLPLALRITGSRLAARPYWPVAHLAARLADPDTRLAELAYGGLELRRSLMPSVWQLPTRARRALLALARVGSAFFHAERAAELLGTSEASAEQDLEHLVDGALLDICGVDRQGRPLYRFHGLVLLLTRSLAGSSHSSDTGSFPVAF
jgi:DNA-binding SARP family transcriptional activator